MRLKTHAHRRTAFGSLEFLERRTLLSGAVAGTKFYDLNSDRDPAGEVGLAGFTVYVDLNNNGILDSGPANAESADVPQALLDQAFVMSNLDVSGVAGAISHLTLNFTINHTFDNDLDVYLLSPGGTRRVLFSSIGGPGQNFINTTLDDQAAISIANGTAPFSGAYRPQFNGALTAFNGQNPNGTWELQIMDSYEGNTGTLVSWSLNIETTAGNITDPSAVTDSNGHYIIPQTPAGTHHTVREVQQQGWSLTAPAAGFHTVAVVDGQTTGGIDFGNTIPPGSVSGVKFNDIVADGSQQIGEGGLAGFILYADINDNGILNGNEPWALSGASGAYTINNIPPGVVKVREAALNHWSQTFPLGAAAHVANVVSGRNTSGIDFGNHFDSTITGSANDDHYYVQLSPNQADVLIFLNNVLDAQVPRSGLNLLTFNAGDGNDSLTVDFVNGNPIPPGAIRFNGEGNSAAGDSVAVIGDGVINGQYQPSGTTPGDGGILAGGSEVRFTGLEPVTVSKFNEFSIQTLNADDNLVIDEPASGQNRVSGSSGGVAMESLTFFNVTSLILDVGANDSGAGDDTITIGPAGMSADGLAQLSLSPGAGQNALTANGGVTNLAVAPGYPNVAITGNNSAVINLSATLEMGALNLNDNARLNLAPNGDNILVATNLAMSANAILQLADNDMIIHRDLATRNTMRDFVEQRIASARGNGSWGGKGIDSSAAAVRPSLITGLAVILNDNAGVPIYTLFDNFTVGTNDTLVKYSYNGDADLSGKVDANDYFLIDSGFQRSLKHYRNGDFNFTGSVDASDYFLIDNAFSRQTTKL